MRFLHFLVATHTKVVYYWGALGHMAELVDALVSGTSGATLGSSSLLMPTTNFYHRAMRTIKKIQCRGGLRKAHKDGQR